MYFIFGITGEQENQDSSILRGVFFDKPTYTPSIVIDRSFDDSFGLQSELKKTFQKVNDRYDDNVTLIGLERIDIIAFRLWWGSEGENKSSFSREYNVYDLAQLIGFKAKTNEKTLDNIFRIVKDLKTVHDFLAK